MIKLGVNIYHFKWILLSLCLFPALTEATELPTFYLDSVKVYKDLSVKYASYWIDESQSVDIDFILRESENLDFQAVGKALPDLKKVFWCKFKIQNTIKEPSVVKDWILDIGKGDYIDVYFVDSLGIVREHQKVGELTPMSEKGLYHKHFVERIPFNLMTAEPMTLYIRLYRISGFPPDLSLDLHQRDFYERDNYKDKASLRWMFFGMLFTFLFLGTGVFFVTRDMAFLYYALFILGLSGYLIDALFNVFGNILFFREYPILVMYLVYALVTLMNTAHMMFIRSYTNSKVNFPTWDRLAHYVVLLNVLLLFVAWGIYYFTKDEFFTDKVIIPVIIVTYFFLISIIFPIIRKGKGTIENYIILSSTCLFTIAIFINAISIFNGTNLRILETQLILLGVIMVFSIGLVISLVYRFHLHQKEKQSLIRLQDLNAIKTQFYQNITHEFRTPITVIKGMAQEIKESVKGKQGTQIEPKIEMIKRSGDNLLELVDQLLNLAKLEKKQLTTNMQHKDIVLYLRYLIASVEPFAKTKKVQIQFFSDELSFFMDFDEEKIRQIFYNILINAIKFSKESGQVNVQVKENYINQLAYLRIEVKDYGVGIPKEDLPLVFERFYQAPSTRSSFSQGAGIGLALVKELVDLLKGFIKIESQLDKGTKVIVDLPIHKNAKKQTQQDRKLVEPSRALANDADEKDTSIAENQQEKPLVLLVEDNEDVLTYLVNILQNDYRLHTADHGQAGIDAAFELIPDIIISDVIMPIMNGYELCNILKKDERTSHIPILLLTAKTRQEDRIDGFAHGADGYITKPFEKKELKIRLANLLEYRQKIQRRLVALPTDQLSNINEIKDKDRLFLKKITEYIQANISDENLDVAQIQRSTNMSRAQLYRKLKALTGLSPGMFKKQIQLKAAYALLSTQELSAKEVAFEVGYKYPSHFSKDFKTFFGISPKEVSKR